MELDGGLFLFVRNAVIISYDLATAEVNNQGEY